MRPCQIVVSVLLALGIAAPARAAEPNSAGSTPAQCVQKVFAEISINPSTAAKHIDKRNLVHKITTGLDVDILSVLLRRNEIAAVATGWAETFAADDGSTLEIVNTEIIGTLLRSAVYQFGGHLGTQPIVVIARINEQGCKLQNVYLGGHNLRTLFIASLGKVFPTQAGTGIDPYDELPGSGRYFTGLRGGDR